MSTLSSAPAAGAPVSVPGKRRASRLARLEARDGYLFISPWLVGFIVFTAGPMLASAVFAFMRYNLFTPPTWIGLANFKQMLTDDLVWLSLYNTVYYTFISVPLRLAASLLLALLCVQNLRGTALFRTMFYLPSVTPAVAMSIVWFWILNPDVGLANNILRALGLPPSNFIWDPKSSKPTFILMQMWSAGGNTMVIFLAGLQNIPQSLYEAAQIDGASGWQQFKSVTVPMLSPVILFNLVMGIVGSFQVFTNAFLMTAGGPANSTLFSVLYMYRLAFEQFEMGYASAFAWLLFVVILIFTILQMRLSQSWVYYEGG